MKTRRSIEPVGLAQNEISNSGEGYTDSSHEYIWRKPKDLEVGDIIEGRGEDQMITSIEQKSMVIYAVELYGVDSGKESRNALCAAVKARPR